jgi:two-component system, OmpR family, response regulator
MLTDSMPHADPRALVFRRSGGVQRSMGYKLLLIEDDAATMAYVARGFEEWGWSVERATSGADGLYLATTLKFDAAVIDRMVPGLDGLSVLKAIRAAGLRFPVVILSALGDVDERVRGLRAGADDYVVKPFSFSELLARIEASMRRVDPTSVNTDLVVEDLRLSLISRDAMRSNRPIKLLPREFKLLEFLMRHVGQVVTRTMLLEGVWDYRFDPHTSIIDTHISRMRKKLEGPEDLPILFTIRGSGYRLGRPS